MKFGGSSLGSAESIKLVLEIVEESIIHKETPIVIVSALQKTTNKLQSAALKASVGDLSYKIELEQVFQYHKDVSESLIIISDLPNVISAIEYYRQELDKVLYGIFLLRELTARTLDHLLCFGELLSSLIISGTFISRGTKASVADARKFIKTDSRFGNAHVLFDQSDKFIQDFFIETDGLQIVPGFIASTISSESTTLGRGGSDYTASIIGAALKVDEIQIWTDVDGILSADPRIVTKAIPITEMSFDEALEMSYFGAKVIYPPTIHPARLKNIPIIIKNTFNKRFAGTKISGQGAVRKYQITGVSTMGKTALLKIHTSGISEEGDMTARLFKTFSVSLIKIILISQASPGNSICFLVDSFNAEKAKILLETELKYEIAEGAINGIEIDSEVSILAVVGENIRNFSGISAKIFNALSTNGINIEAVAQGSSRLNISLVIKRKDESKALNAIHDTFFLSEQKTINLFIAGTGLIGRTLYQQLKNQADFLINDRKLELKIIGIANTRRMLFDTSGLDLENWENRLKNEEAASDTDSFIGKMIEYNLPNSLFVDCTSSEKIIARYLDVLTSAISIVTPNKKANSTHFNYYLKLRAAAIKHNVHFLYETNVGAGLPIISTLQDLVFSGDKILKIEGVLSGTLSYIFNTFSANRSFSETVIEARKKGFTEPDPRDDLNGLDVARKLLILVREAQYPLELDEIELQNLIPVELRDTTNVEDFLNNLHLYDNFYEELRGKAEKNGNVLRYIAIYENGKASVKLTEVNQYHPFYSLSSNDNILSLTTVYYNNSPMVIRGPGAGAKVTSGGVLADIVRIANYL